MVFQPTTFGRYVLLKRIAIGGMAEIFRAIAYGAEGFEKVVAIKRMLPHLSSDHQFVDMFINEAKLAASLSHANIVQIYDFGCIDNLLFLSMEYIHGKDISEITGSLRTRKLSTPVELACHVFIEVLNGLHHAHRQRDHFGNPLNLIHRDMSPPNIIVSYDGEVKIADFGIAKATRTKVQTSSGVLKGKYSYMSPEQANGQILDRRTDIFSLGICFYEMLTLSEAFSGNSELEVLRKVRSAEITPPRELNPRIPEALETVLLKALAKNPDDRYSSAAEWRDALEKFLVDNNLRFSTSALSGFINDIFQADILKEREQLAREAQTAEDLRPEARSIARLEATAAGELDTLVIDQDDQAWPLGNEPLDQGIYADEESGEESTIRIDLDQLGLDDPEAHAVAPTPPAPLGDSDFEVDDEEEDTQLLEEIPAEIAAREEIPSVSALAQVRPRHKKAGIARDRRVEKPASIPGALPAPELIVGKMVSYPVEPVTETRDEFGATGEASVITQTRDQPFEIKEPTFDEVRESEENFREEKNKFPWFYLLFGILVASAVVGVIALATGGNDSAVKGSADGSNMATATMEPSDRSARKQTEKKPEAAVPPNKLQEQKPPADAGPPPPAAPELAPKPTEPPQAKPQETLSSRSTTSPETPEHKVEPQEKTRKEKKKKSTSNTRNKKISSRGKRHKSSFRKSKKKSSKRRGKTSRRKHRSRRRKKTSERRKKSPTKKTTGKTKTTLVVDGVPVNNLSGLERKLRPGVHVMELRDQNGKVLRRWKVRVGKKNPK